MARAPDCLVSLFAKTPRAGEVKTRLIPRLGDEGASRFHARCVQRALRTALDAGVGAVEICCAPDASSEFFRDTAASLPVSLADQGTGDLGERMHRALDRGLEHHAAMILIGADCPALTVQDLRDAALALQSHDAVISPAEDGGYVLIGCRSSNAGLFENIRWSTGVVMARTRDNIARLNWTVHELRTLWDVDRPQDYDRLRDDTSLRDALCED